MATTQQVPSTLDSATAPTSSARPSDEGAATNGDEMQRRFEQAMADLLRRLATPLPADEKVRRRAWSAQMRRLRDCGPSISPDTTEQYIDEVRAEQADPAGRRFA